MMAYPKWARKCNRVAMATAVSFCSVAFCAGQADFVTSVTSTHPIAYYRLDATSGKSQVGVSTYKSQGGASQGRGSLPTGLSTYVQLDGHDGWILSTQKGGVTTAASIMAWINLADLPSKTGRIFYVAGESQSGNDLDVQIEQDDVLRFFTAGGGNLQFKPEQASLLNQWHMIVATLDTVSKARSLYWDGKQVAHDMGGGTSNKQNAFSIGASTTWGDRWLKGGVAEAALWNRALKAAEVTSIYASANGAASGVAPAHAASTGSGAAASGTGPFATTAKIEINDTKGPMQLKRPEQIAILFLTGMEQIERDCQLKNDVVIAKKSNASNIDGKKITDIYPVKVSASHCNVPYLNQLKKEDILAELSASLPAYMVPNVLVALKSVPLTSNGKLDTRALPDIDPDIASEQYVEPVTTAEQEMCKIWQAVLGLPRVGITDDFFKIGGSSILAIQVTSLTNKTLGYNIKVADLFSRKSIAKLLEHLQVAEAESTSLIKPYHDVYHKALSDLIFIHPGNAGSEMYQHLADMLTSGYNCIGVDNFNIQHKRKIDSLSELATHYLTEYETKYSFKEPVNLFGWSLGGQIALEMASILEERDYRNINVILLDTMLTDDNLRKLRSSENNKEIIKQMRGLLKVEMAEEYVEKVIAGVDAEVTLTNTPISNILKYTNVVLFKATQQETRLNTPATKLIFDYTKLIAGNNIDLVANHLSVINMDCNHFNILDVYSTYLSHYLLKKAYNTTTNVGVSNAVFDGQ